MTTADNVRVGVTGEVMVGLTSATLPTDGTGAGTTPSGFTALGYCTDDGVEQTIDEDITTIQAWQNGDIVRKVRSSHDVTFGFTLMESSADVLEAYYGNSDVEIKGGQMPHKSWVIDVLDGDHSIRIVIPDGMVTERNAITYANGEAVTYGVTITAFPDSTGVKAYKYLVDDSS